MKQKTLPFNIALLDTDRRRIAGLLPVQVLDMYDGSTGNFHPRGLYSSEIFGRVGTEERNSRHGYITLNCQILHPKLYDEMVRMKSLYGGIMRGREYATWDPELKDFVRSDVLDGETGYAFFMRYFDQIEFKRSKSYRRDIVIDLLEKYKDRAKLSWLIVMPAGLRDVEEDESGRPVEQEINKLYRKVLAAANSISPTLANKNDPLLNQTRWSIQNNVQAIWDLIIGMLGGKQGFLQAKWGSRRVAFATANVISAMDPAPDDLSSPRSFDSNTLHVGINQTLRGTEILMVAHQMPNGIARELIEGVDGEVRLIDPKYLKAVDVALSEKERVRWGSEKGRSELIHDFGEVGRRHQPIMIDGHYLKLIYNDGHQIRLLDGAHTFPSDRDPAHVSALTWAEYFYIEVMAYIARVRCYNTRYPITGPNSIYAAVPYIRSTVNAQIVRWLNDDWRVDESKAPLPEFPNTPLKAAFFDTCAPHPTALEGLGADFDGDRNHTTFVFGDESVREIDAKMNDKRHYLNAAGEINQPSGVETIERVLRNFTGFF